MSGLLCQRCGYPVVEGERFCPVCAQDDCDESYEDEWKRKNELNYDPEADEPLEEDGY